jgi:long-chain acyl-CoA synthetase
MEQSTFINSLVHGFRTGYYSGDPLILMEDVLCLRPTAMASVPRMLKRIHAKIMESLPPLKSGEKHDKKILEAVYGKVKLIFGGRLRLFFSASASIPNEVMSFYKEALGIHVYESYGLTEISGPGTFTHPLDKHSTGHVGGLIPTLRARLRDCPELGYLSTDAPPRGEIQFKGTSVFKRYFKNPSST